jgi:hypothetical protein
LKQKLSELAGIAAREKAQVKQSLESSSNSGVSIDLSVLLYYPELYRLIKRIDPSEQIESPSDFLHSLDSRTTALNLSNSSDDNLRKSLIGGLIGSGNSELKNSFIQLLACKEEWHFAPIQPVLEDVLMNGRMAPKDRLNSIRINA